MHDELPKLLQRYVANVAITAAAMRNQGASGVVAVARRFLADLDLRPLPSVSPVAYRTWLDESTDSLLRRLPVDAKNWGAARKGVNIFMVQTFMNGALAREYNLARLGDALETPLDDQAAKELRNLAGRGQLPRWPSLRRLSVEVSDQYQAFASEVARKRAIPRAYLDTILWRARA